MRNLGRGEMAQPGITGIPTNNYGNAILQENAGKEKCPEDFIRALFFFFLRVSKCQSDEKTPELPWRMINGRVSSRKTTKNYTAHQLGIPQSLAMLCFLP